MNNSAFELLVRSDIDDIPPSGIELLRSQTSPFLDYDWFRAFSEHVCYALGNPKWLILQQYGNVIAILPMVEREVGRTRILSSMTNYYSPYFDLVSDALTPRRFLLERIIETADSFFHLYDILEFLPITEEVQADFLAAFANSNWHLHKYGHTINFRKNGISDFASYWLERPSKLKSTLKRKQKKLLGVDHRFKIYAADLSDLALAQYHSAYFTSWKVNEPFPAFIDQIARQASLSNILRLGILYIDGKVAATQLWLVKNGTAYIVKLAYNPKYSNYSVGTLLSAHMFEYVISQDKVSSVDYLTGEDEYKNDWMSERRTLYGLQLSNPRTLWGRLSTVKNQVGIGYRAASKYLSELHKLLSGWRNSRQNNWHFRRGDLMSIRENICFVISRRLLTQPMERTVNYSVYEDWRSSSLARSWESFSDSHIHGKDVLDFGCGDGPLSFFLATEKHPRKMLGVDISADAIHRANSALIRISRTTNIPIEFRLGETDTLPVVDQSYDTIVAFDCLEHVMSPAEILKDWHRVLRPGGRCLIEWFPYSGPWGPHMEALIPIPWAHFIFGQAAMFRAAERIYDLPEFIPRHWDLDGEGKKKPNKWQAWSSFREQGYINELNTASFKRLAEAAGFHIERFEKHGFAGPKWRLALGRMLMALPLVGDYFVSYVCIEIVRK